MATVLFPKNPLLLFDIRVDFLALFINVFVLPSSFHQIHDCVCYLFVFRCFKICGMTSLVAQVYGFFQYILFFYHSCEIFIDFK